MEGGCARGMQAPRRRKWAQVGKEGKLLVLHFRPHGCYPAIVRAARPGRSVSVQALQVCSVLWPKCWYTRSRAAPVRCQEGGKGGSFVWVWVCVWDVRSRCLLFQTCLPPPPLSLGPLSLHPMPFKRCVHCVSSGVWDVVLYRRLCEGFQERGSPFPLLLSLALSHTPPPPTTTTPPTHPTPSCLCASWHTSARLGTPGHTLVRHGGPQRCMTPLATLTS
jgi:hypothetical protein